MNGQYSKVQIQARPTILMMITAIVAFADLDQEFDTVAILSKETRSCVFERLTGTERSKTVKIRTKILVSAPS